MHKLELTRVGEEDLLAWSAFALNSGVVSLSCCNLHLAPLGFWYLVLDASLLVFSCSLDLLSSCLTSFDVPLPYAKNFLNNLGFGCLPDFLLSPFVSRQAKMQLTR